MNKYVINYEYGVADFFTNETDVKKVLAEFHDCANECFGTRKSIGNTSISLAYAGALLPLPYRGHDATHFLSHNGDEILFDRRVLLPGGEGWKLHNEWGDWCSCADLGTPALSCQVHHHFWVPGHDEICECLKRD